LTRLLKAAGYELRMHLEPDDDHDEVLRDLEERLSPEERERWESYQATRVAKDRVAVDTARRSRRSKLPS
jgi:hypothetical protein